MLKWIILAVGLLIAIIFVVAFIKFMLKTEKDSKKTTVNKEVKQEEEYKPMESSIDIPSASGGIPITDMSNHNDIKTKMDFDSGLIDDVPDLPMPRGNSGFIDDLDDDFTDFSNFAHNSKGRRRIPLTDFDLDGDMADEYIPSSPDFSYLPKRRPTKKQPIDKALNELPTELKVLMLSDIFDRKFFD